MAIYGLFQGAHRPIQGGLVAHLRPIPGGLWSIPVGQRPYSRGLGGPIRAIQGYWKAHFEPIQEALRPIQRVYNSGFEGPSRGDGGRWTF